MVQPKIFFKKKTVHFISSKGLQSRKNQSFLGYREQTAHDPALIRSKPFTDFPEGLYGFEMGGITKECDFIYKKVGNFQTVLNEVVYKV